MNTLFIIATLALAQVPPPPQPGTSSPNTAAQQPIESPGVVAQHKAIDYMTTEQQKQWLLAHLMVDLHFNDKKIAEWEKKLSAMTPTMTAVTVKAYVLQQEKKRLQDDRNYAIRVAKMQLQAQTSWYRSYYKYRYYNYSNYSYPGCYGPGCFGYGGMYQIYLPFGYYGRRR